MSCIDLKFLDGQNETKLYNIHTSSKMKDVLVKYLEKINNPYKGLDPNVFVFLYGTKILNKGGNLEKTIDEIGLQSDYEIILSRKKDRNYAKKFKNKKIIILNNY